MTGRTRWWWSAPTTTIWVWVGPMLTRATRAGFIPAPTTTPAGLRCCWSWPRRSPRVTSRSATWCSWPSAAKKPVGPDPEYFVEHPGGLSTDGIRGVINLDTVGRMGDKPVSILGTGTADEWQHIFRGASYVTGVESRNVPESAEASDQMSFIEKGIPGIQIFTSAHSDYHRPSDTADKIDAAGLVKVATLAKEAVVYMGAREEPLTVTIERASGQDQPAARPAGGPSSGRRVRLGTVPDFAFPGPGVKVDQVSAGSPAEAAGFLAGDVLMRIDEAEVTDLRRYSEILRTLEPGQRVRGDGGARGRRGDPGGDRGGPLG